MKKLITASLISGLLSFVTYAQTSQAPDGAAGLKFGMSPSEVKAIWKTKGTLYKDYTPIQTGIGVIMYTDIKVGTETFDFGAAKFVNNKLYDIMFTKVPEEEGFAQGIYDNLQQILLTKYPQGKIYRFFEGIYEDGDGYEMQAVRLGKGTISTYWDFSPVCIIALQIKLVSDMIVVNMQYQSSELANEVDKIIKKTNEIEF